MVDFNKYLNRPPVPGGVNELMTQAAQRDAQEPRIYTEDVPEGVTRAELAAAVAEGKALAAVAPIDPIPVQTDLPIGQHEFELLVGTAGTGKTFTAKRLQAQMGSACVLAATTGIAAVNLGEGTTIHSLLRFFDLQSARDAYRHGTIQAQLRKLRKAGLRRIVLDEISMLQGELLSILARSIQEVNALAHAESDDEQDRPNRTPPPPIGLTLIGDFGQLPPVPDKDPKTGRSIPATFAFESECWNWFEAHTTKLEKIWRQDDQAFIGALHAVRRGDVATALAFFGPDRFSEYTDEDYVGTTIFAKNIEVDRHNQLMLDRLTGRKISYTAKRWGKPRGEWKQIPDVLELKVGALVMILANRRQYDDELDEKGRMIYANGDLGTIVKESDQNIGWTVKLQRTGGNVTVVPIVREHTIPLEPGRKDELRSEATAVILQRFREGQYIASGYVPAPSDAGGDVLGERNTLAEFLSSQFFEGLVAQWLQGRITEDGKSEIIGTVEYMPLRAAYGCTVHKTQGLTLDRVQVNIRDPFFGQPGMLFVALSRARSAEGLRIVGSQKAFVERMKVAEKVRRWL